MQGITVACYITITYNLQWQELSYSRTKHKCLFSCHTKWLLLLTRQCRHGSPYLMFDSVSAEQVRPRKLSSFRQSRSSNRSSRPHRSARCVRLWNWGMRRHNFIFLLSTEHLLNYKTSDKARVWPQNAFSTKDSPSSSSNKMHRSLLRRNWFPKTPCTPPVL